MYYHGKIMSTKLPIIMFLAYKLCIQDCIAVSYSKLQNNSCVFMYFCWYYIFNWIASDRIPLFLTKLPGNWFINIHTSTAHLCIHVHPTIPLSIGNLIPACVSNTSFQTFYTHFSCHHFSWKSAVRRKFENWTILCHLLPILCVCQTYSTLMWMTLHSVKCTLLYMPTISYNALNTIWCYL